MKLLRVIAREMDNLPLGVATMIHSRLIGQHLPDLATFNLEGHSACR